MTYTGYGGNKQVVRTPIQEMMDLSKDFTERYFDSKGGSEAPWS
jgi:hypothetical protein